MANRDKEENKLVIVSSTTGSVVRKIDGLGSYVASVCTGHLKNRVGDGQMLNEFLQDMHKLRRAHTINKTMKNQLSKSYKSLALTK